MKPIQSLFLLSFFASLVVWTSCNEVKSDTGLSRNNENPIQQNVDSIVKPLIEDTVIAGAVVGIAQNGKIKFLKSYGYSDLNKKIPLEDGAVFPIASVSKTFTAIATMQLVEEGLIRLDANIYSYIDFDTKDKAVTIEQLLNHTSGIKDYTETDISGRLEEKGYSTDSLMQWLEEKPFDFDPTDAMDYNNSGYYLLAEIIEKVSGLTYEEYLSQYIFKPTHMTNTANCYASSINSKLVSGYTMSNEEKLDAVALGDFQVAKGAGSICSTVEDLLKWQIAFHHSKTLLDKSSYDLMTSKSKLPKGGLTNYGLGLEINQYKGNQVVSHNGVIEGYLADTRYFPESDLTIITLINTLGPVKPANISNAIADYIIEEKNITKAFEGDFGKLSGSYAGVVMGHTIKMDILQENGQWFIESRDNKTRLEYIGQNTWLAEDGYIYVFFDNKMQVNAPKLSIIFTKSE